MQYAVYIDTPIPRSGGKFHRHYVQTNHSGIVDLYNPLDGYGKLDSHPILFDTEKSVLTFASEFCKSCSDFTGVYTIGYHGVTENGNACRPFCTVYRGQDRVKTNLTAAYNNLCKMEEAYEQFHLPGIARIANSHVERSYTLTREQLMGELDQILANMVDEELINVLSKIESLEKNQYVCTDVDMYEASAVVHYENISVFPTRKLTLTITALNLYDEAAIKELGSLNERIFAAGIPA